MLVYALQGRSRKSLFPIPCLFAERSINAEIASLQTTAGRGREKSVWSQSGNALGEMKLLTNHGSSSHLYLVVAIQPEDKIKIQLSFILHLITECKLMQHKRKSAVKCNFERLQTGEFIFLQVCQRTEILQIQQSDWFCERALFYDLASQPGRNSCVMNFAMVSFIFSLIDLDSDGSDFIIPMRWQMKVTKNGWNIGAIGNEENQQNVDVDGKWIF